MNIVIDASAVIAVLLNEPAKPALVARTTGATLIAPASIHWEVGNAFSAMLKRRRLTLEHVLKALDAYVGIPIRLLNVDMAHALTIADQLGIYAYDAYLIVCALDHKCPLLTLDSGLRNAAQVAGVTIVEVQP